MKYIVIDVEVIEIGFLIRSWISPRHGLASYSSVENCNQYRCICDYCSTCQIYLGLTDRGSVSLEQTHATSESYAVTSKFSSRCTRSKHIGTRLNTLCRNYSGIYDD